MARPVRLIVNLNTNTSERNHIFGLAFLMCCCGSNNSTLRGKSVNSLRIFDQEIQADQLNLYKEKCIKIENKEKWQSYPGKHFSGAYLHPPISSQFQKKFSKITSAGDGCCCRNHEKHHRFIPLRFYHPHLWSDVIFRTDKQPTTCRRWLTFQKFPRTRHRSVVLGGIYGGAQPSVYWIIWSKQLARFTDPWLSSVQ